MDVLERIKYLQKLKGWSTYRLANESCLTQSTISNMFYKNTSPTIDTLQQICKGFGISISEFFADEMSFVQLSANEKELVSEYRKLTAEEKKTIGEMLKMITAKK